MATRKDKVGRSKASREEKKYTAPTSLETETSQAPMGHQDGIGTSGVTVPEVLQAQAQSGSDATATQAQTAVTSPWEQMLAERRKTLAKEKTDAQKMQKYYALSDALKTLGQMGGAAIGGAIGGETLAGATVPEFKQHRGYIDAFEKAKEANDALRKLDDAEFQLRYTDQQKADERKYNETREKVNRDFQAQQAELTRQYQSEQARITREWQAAVADKDFERQAALKREIAEMDQKFKLQYQAIANAHDTAIKQMSLEITKLQNSGKKKPVMFNDGSAISIPDSYYTALKTYLTSGEKWDGRAIDKDNVDMFIKNNPDKVKDILTSFGYSADAKAPEGRETKPEQKASGTKLFAGKSTVDNLGHSTMPNGSLSGYTFPFSEYSGYNTDSVGYMSPTQIYNETLKNLIREGDDTKIYEFFNTVPWPADAISWSDAIKEVERERKEARTAETEEGEAGNSDAASKWASAKRK